MTPPLPRREKLRRLAEEPFDVLIVGGGINGAGIAREAALRGLRTALVEKGDFASGTSSRSSKLIHGGFRYLEQGSLWLVLESSRERDLLRRSLAPHLVRPMPFFFPVYPESPVGLWTLRAGLLLYDLLATFQNIQRHRVAGPEEARSIEPNLRSAGLRGGALYYDCATDDARLVLETVLGAEQAGAICLNYVGVERLRKTAAKIDGAVLHDRDGHEAPFGARTRVVVNATGPWLDRIRALDDPGAKPLLRLTKGSHLVVPRDRIGNRNAVVLHAVADRRVLFVIPWEEHALIGTTDTDFEGDLDRVVAEAEDVAYLLETINEYFPKARLTERDVVSTFAGLRPLVDGDRSRSPSEISREDVIDESPSGLLSIGGGKLTTYRRISRKVVDRVAQRLEEEYGMRVRADSGTDQLPLPGALDGNASPGADSMVSKPDFPPDVVAFLVDRYGRRASEVIALAREAPELFERLAPDAKHVRAEAWFGAASEMALRVEDVLRRRTQLALRTADQGAGAAALVADLMAHPLGWDEDTAEQKAREYRKETGESWRLEPAVRKKA